MSVLGELLQIAAATLPVWRDAALATLAAVVIACLWLYASLMDGG